MVRLNVKFQKIAFPALYFRPSKLWYQELRLPGHVCSENIIIAPPPGGGVEGLDGGGGLGGRHDSIMKLVGESAKTWLSNHEKAAMVATLPCRPVTRVEWVRGGHKV